MIESLPIDKASSFFGDELRPVDCPDDKDLPYGTCGNFLFGGAAMVDSHLNGTLRIQFFPPVGNISHFQVIHGTLNGEDAILQAPQGFDMPFINTQVTDAPGLLSEGDLDLTTGVARNIRYNVLFYSSSLDALGNVNPNLVRPVISYPGVRGWAWARFEQRPDGLLDFTFKGSTFLPLGKSALGDLIRWPLGICNGKNQCASILARGTSLRPHLALSTKPPEGPECGNNCADLPSNTIQEFTAFSYATSFGDDFSLDIPQLGGTGPGRSHLMGRFQVQFGPRSGDSIGITITSLVPEGLLAAPPPSPLLQPGLAIGLIGQNEILKFPLLSYPQTKLALLDEPFNFPHGEINLKTGKAIGEFIYPSFYAQKMLEVLFDINDGRISFDPFLLVGLKTVDGSTPTTYTLFEKGPNGETVFRFSGEHKRSFATFRWPSTDFSKANSFIGGSNATLDLFMRVQAMHTADTPLARKVGSISNVTSSLGDIISYSYSVPCNSSGADFAFRYSNNNPGLSGGTFDMKSLASVQCINSRTSTLPPGDYDAFSFSGFGTWSKDASDAPPRFAAVHISTSPDSPYVGIIVFQNPDSDNNVVLSSANTKPAEKTLP